jgi:hypothetical protein
VPLKDEGRGRHAFPSKKIRPFMLCDYDFNLRKIGDKITTSVAAAAAVPKNGYRVESKVYIVYLRLLRVMLETAGNVVQYKPYLY